MKKKIWEFVDPKFKASESLQASHSTSAIRSLMQRLHMNMYEGNILSLPSSPAEDDIFDRVTDQESSPTPFEVRPSVKYMPNDINKKGFGPSKGRCHII